MEISHHIVVDKDLLVPSVHGVVIDIAHYHCQSAGARQGRCAGVLDYDRDEILLAFLPVQDSGGPDHACAVTSGTSYNTHNFLIRVTNLTNISG